MRDTCYSTERVVVADAKDSGSHSAAAVHHVGRWIFYACVASRRQQTARHLVAIAAAAVARRQLSIAQSWTYADACCVVFG